ncbi:MAG: glycosyl hydrolase family 8 [Fibrobacterales bacterium]
MRIYTNKKLVIGIGYGLLMSILGCSEQLFEIEVVDVSSSHTQIIGGISSSALNDTAKISHSNPTVRKLSSDNSDISTLSSSEAEKLSSQKRTLGRSSKEDTSESLVLSSDHQSSTVYSPPIDYPIASTVPDQRVEKDWTPVLNKTWEGMKRRNVDPYPFGLLHRPKSETPNDAVSEGQGYGMMMALYSNDQEYFNKIYEAARVKMWNGTTFNWRLWDNGTLAGENGATDADQDIALMLVYADHLVKKGVWRETADKPYMDEAHEIIGSLRHNFLTGDVLKPGNKFGSVDALNPGYCTPAFYRIFKQVTGDTHWDAVRNKCYDMIEANPGYSKGLLPDWMNAWGGLLPKGPGYNAYLNGQAMFKDAIRIYWRVANDAIWFGEPRAKKFLQNAIDFIKTKADKSDPNYPADAADYFQLDGSLVPQGDRWEHEGFSRWRREHSHLTLGMWATAAYGAGDMEAAEAFSRELAEFYEEGSDTWGLTVDPSGNEEDQAHNELYFDQFLAWYGAAMLNGNFCNILDCVK